ncbi:MAG: DMT family transporter [Spirochaetes bacterium]|nr:DMT family transporter [Spirochaetota bacterium]
MKKSDFTLIIAVICWGMSFIWTKEALSTLSVYSIIFIRFSSASLILFFISVLMKKNLKIGSGILKMIILTMFQPFAYFLFETNALKYISTQKASLIAATIPIFVLVITSFQKKKLPGIMSIISVFISIAGIILLLGINFGVSETGTSLKGNVLMFGAVISAAVYILLTNYFAGEFDIFVITFYQMLLGSVMLLPLFVADNCFNGTVHITPPAAAGLFFLVIFSTITGFLSYNYSISKSSTSKSALYLNAVPVVTIIAAFIIRKEILTAMEFSGAVLIITSLYLITKTSGGTIETDNSY